MISVKFLSLGALVGVIASAYAVPAASEKRDYFSNVAELAESVEEISVTTEPLSQFSFDNWGGIQSLNDFDGFYGIGNFDGRWNQLQSIDESVVEVQPLDVNLVQQYLSILQEYSKYIILSSIQEVETQTILVEQLYSRWNVFSEDLRRISGREIGYDSSISSLINQLVLPGGEYSQSNFDFSGYQVGSHLRQYSDNWDASISPDRVHAAWIATQDAVLPASDSLFASP